MEDVNMKSIKLFVNEIIVNELTNRGYNEKQIDEISKISQQGISYSEQPIYQESVEIESLNKGKGRSIKYLIKFNLASLFEALATFAITIAGSVNYPWISLIGILILLKQLASASSFNLNENTCKVLWIMWLINKGEIKENTGELKFENIYKTLNFELSNRSLPSIAEMEVKDALIMLEDLSIIEQLGDKWELIEFIQVNKEN